MKVRVICGDGSLATVDITEIEDLAEDEKIAAYKIRDRWVEVRRRPVTNPGYQGPERRKSHFFVALEQ